MTDVVSTPPDQTVWWDPAVTETNVLARLRLAGSDIDAAQVRQAIPAAGTAINHELDRDVPLQGPPPDPALQEALEVATIDVYHQGGLGATVGAGQSALPSSAPFDPLANVRLSLVPFKLRWGVA